MPESGVFYIVILTAVGLLIRNQGGIDMASTACIFLSRKILESIFFVKLEFRLPKVKFSGELLETVFISTISMDLNKMSVRRSH